MPRTHGTLSRRERQIMDFLYRKGQATAAEVMENLPKPPSYSAVRALLRILEEKSHVRHEESGVRYVFMPRIPRQKAQRSALRHLLNTFFDGSAEDAVATLLDVSSSKLSDEELDRLAALIEKARDTAKKRR
jgi:predicted transcriptional regulator